MAEDQPNGEPGSKPSDARRIWTISVASSIIASAIFLVFFQPILEAVSKGLAALLSYAAVGLLDVMYHQAAMGVERAISLTIFAITISVLMGAAIAPIIFYFIRRVYKKGPESRNRIRNLAKSISTVEVFFISIPAILIGFYILSFLFIAVQATASYDGYIRAGSRRIYLRRKKSVLLPNGLE